MMPMSLSQLIAIAQPINHHRPTKAPLPKMYPVMASELDGTDNRILCVCSSDIDRREIIVGLSTMALALDWRDGKLTNEEFLERLPDIVGQREASDGDG